MRKQNKRYKGCFGKKRYDYFLDAGYVVGGFKIYQNKKLFIYYCYNCQGFHLSSKKKTRGTKELAIKLNKYKQPIKEQTVKRPTKEEVAEAVEKLKNISEELHTIDTQLGLGTDTKYINEQVWAIIGKLKTGGYEEYWNYYEGIDK